MENYKIEKLEINLGDIPVTVIRPEIFSKNRKTIIHYHGWSSNVENQILLGEIFAHKGYQVILPEVANHGERGTDDYSNFIGMANVIIQSLAEFRDIKDLAINRLNGDKDNLVVSGHSMGGMITGALLALDTSIKAGLIFNSLVDFRTILNEVEGIDQATKETLLLFNPIEKIENFASRNLAIFVGDQDHLIPKEAMINFEKTLQEKNIDSKNIVFNFYHDCGHAISYKAIKDGLEFIYKNIGFTDFSCSCKEKSPLEK